MTIINLDHYRCSAQPSPVVEGTNMRDDVETTDVTWPMIWAVAVLVAIVLASAAVHAWAP